MNITDKLAVKFSSSEVSDILADQFNHNKELIVFENGLINQISILLKNTIIVKILLDLRGINLIIGTNEEKIEELETEQHGIDHVCQRVQEKDFQQLANFQIKLYSNGSVYAPGAFYHQPIALTGKSFILELKKLFEPV